MVYFTDSLHIIKMLKEFQYVDEDGKDCGAYVRQKAKDVFNLLSDTTRLREARRNRAPMRDRMVRGRLSMEEEEEELGRGRRSTVALARRNQENDSSDEELSRAAEALRLGQTYAEEQARQEEEKDHQHAILLVEEEVRRNKAVEDQEQLYVISPLAGSRIELPVDPMTG